MNKILLTILSATLLLAGCSEPATPPERPEVVMPTEATTIEPTAAREAFPFEAASCPFDVPEEVAIECGFVIVPEDHNDPGGPTIRIALAVLKDQSAAHRPDPVMLLHGGPGAKILTNTPQLTSLLAPLHPNRDLIFFDQRGVGLSEPALECPEWLDLQLELLDETDPNIVLQQAFEAWMVCRDRLSSEGHNLSVYNTLQNAADVDAIRIALGYDQVNLYGASYGSHLAQAVMRDHPEGIRSAVIASVWPLEKSFSVDLSTTTSNGILRLLAACAADEACNGAYPNLQDVLFEVSDRLNAEPVPITLTHPLSGESYAAMLTGDAVVSNLVAFLYVTDIIPILPQAVYDVYNGDYQLMTQLSSTKLVLFEDLSRGVMFPTICTDDLIGRTPQDLLNVRAAVPSQLVGSADPELVIEYSVFNICENWPIEESAPWVKEPLVTDIPTLVLGSEFDPVTPPEYGRLVAGQLNDSYFFEFPGVGHNITVDECARNIAGNFMHNPTQIPDATCLEEMKGVVFELPSETDALTLEPFIDESRGFSGLVPKDWDELAPGNLVQSKTALVPAYFVLEAKPVPASELLASLTSQLGMGAALEPSATADLGNFAWSFYTFELQGNLVDLALAEDVEKAYFVFMMSPPEEHAALHEQLFLPAVEAMAPAT